MENGLVFGFWFAVGICLFAVVFGVLGTLLALALAIIRGIISALRNLCREFRTDFLSYMGMR
jgi:hypothetical protein